MNNIKIKILNDNMTHFNETKKVKCYEMH